MAITAMFTDPGKIISLFKMQRPIFGVWLRQPSQRQEQSF